MPSSTPFSAPSLTATSELRIVDFIQHNLKYVESFDSNVPCFLIPAQHSLHSLCSVPAITQGVFSDKCCPSSSLCCGDPAGLSCLRDALRAGGCSETAPARFSPGAVNRWPVCHSTDMQSSVLRYSHKGDPIHGDLSQETLTFMFILRPH